MSEWMILLAEEIARETIDDYTDDDVRRIVEILTRFGVKHD